MIQRVALPFFACSCAFFLLGAAAHFHPDYEEAEGAIYSFDAQFTDTRDLPTFVDKTRFIKYFYNKNELMVIHAPPRFGKTANLKMLQMFFEVPVDSTGAVIQNYIFEKRQFFDTMLTCKDDDSFFCMEYISSHPVIYMDFNSLETEDLESFCTSFRAMISSLFQQHEYLGRSEFLTKAERNVFDQDLHPSGHPLLRNGTYALGGKDLSKLLHEHFNLTCMVLIDNYDAPATKLILERNKDNSEAEILKILSDLITGLLKNNKYVSHALLAGVSNVGNIYTQPANELKYHSIFEEKTLIDFYGLRFKDIEDILGRFGRQSWLEEARHMYEGYHVLGTNEKLYNSRSFPKYVETKGLVGDFEPIPALTHLQHLFEYENMGQVIEKTLEKNESIIRKLTLFSEHDIKNLNNLVFKHVEGEIPIGTEHLMLQFLQEHGCYTITSKNEQMCRVEIAVPNLEVKKILKNLVYTEKFFTEKYKINKEILKNYVQSVVKLDKSENSFRVFISAVSALFEKVMPETDHEFQAPLYILPKLISSESFLEVNDQVLYATNKSQIDALMTRKDGTFIIFEFRFDQASAFDALQEIVNKEYYKVKTKLNNKSRNKILVGLHYNKFRESSVSYLYNNFNITNAVNVTLGQINKKL